MLKSILKYVSISLLIILILSVSINKKPTFYYVYDIISPVTIKAQKEVESFFERSISGTKTYSKKIFENSVPKVNDSIKSKLSSHRNKKLIHPQENIKDEEKAELDKLIRKY